MYCTKCGKTVEDGTRFCPHCGARLDRPTTNVQGEQQDNVETTVMPRVEERAPDGKQAVAPGVGPSTASSGSGSSDAGSDDASVAGVTQPLPVVRSASRTSRTAQTGRADTHQAGTDEAPANKPSRTRIVIIVLVVVLICLVAAGIWFVWSQQMASTGSGSSEADEEQADVEESSALQVLSLSARSISTDSYPLVSVDFSVTTENGEDVPSLSESDFSIVEEDENGHEYAATVDALGTLGDGSSLELIYRSSLDQSEERTTIISLNESSGYTGECGFYTTVTQLEAEDADEDSDVDEADDESEDEQVTSDDSSYMLPDSDTHRYTASELSGYSNWELFIARNEIYARHGREFSNEDLQAYFGSKSWYTPRYAPEDFDAASLLNEVEMENVETILSIEQDRDSPYQA